MMYNINDLSISTNATASQREDHAFFAELPVLHSVDGDGVNLMLILTIQPDEK